MAEYIEREALRLGIFNTMWRDSEDVDIAYDMAESIPTADVVEVKHGRWIKKWHDNNLIGHEYEECSVCGCLISDTEKFWDCNYCPNCGARIDGE